MTDNLLVVTDHTTHGPTNSLYDLVHALREDPRSDKIWICSRGLPENSSFFSGESVDSVFAAEADDDIIFDSTGDKLRIASKEVPLDIMKAILVRMPQPLNKEFMRSLESIVDPVRIVNHPSGTILTSSKEFLVSLSHICPRPVMVYSPEEAVALSREYEIVLKPLYSYGGRGIARLSKDLLWLGMEKYEASMAEVLLTKDQFPMLSMKYLHNVSLGDKRTIVVNKNILGSALRLPAENSWICNVAQGGHAEMSTPDKDELRIEEELTPLLFARGVVMYGYDTLVDDEGKRVLSEINTLSIGGLGPMTEMSGMPILQQAAKGIWDYLSG